MADEKSSVPAPVPAPASAVRPKLLDRQALPRAPAREGGPAGRPTLRGGPALERVLARAAELQGAGAIPESSDLISESQLLEIGSEVGIGSAMLNQALAEERTRVTVPEERGLVAQIAGARFAKATRTVPGTPRGVLATIENLMQRDECLQVQRRFSDRITWVWQRGLFGKIRRTVN